MSHDIRIRPDGKVRGKQHYRAYCDCGWRSQRLTVLLAVLDAAMHHQEKERGL